ncbi:60S ribosomal subunit assembly or modification protein [Yamadazyma tenuis]|uniref:WD40 repeat-like protein n=1 Tax=Candida tenuis (strain ATCC 10573 / BCRC 21748 / CBS 615 / JCM 9827 / NBRC 10315 / NRRL Y-1498 / VKM Y-70) TaxID=590646 RepID=G3B4M6_CANTC|nr:WD40 repeat-like protein [Yamadazyma tenuis ATCC 10573]EGV63982.1 WD40 repeat-like protein [Yamadazyma tenuis ATCC 10573]WEJ96396.1 60S ribosomal subunit assembly or modification protein [Yamadazyma tenuis]
MSAPQEYINEEEPEEEFLRAEEVGEEVPDDTNLPPPDDEDDEDIDMEQDITIDLSNNSWTYFDQHKDSIFTIFRHPTLPMVVTGGGDNTAYLWTTHTQPPRFVGELSGHKESVVAGGFTSDGKYVVTADMNGFIQVHKSSKGGQRWIKFGELQEVEEVLWVRVHPRLPYFAFGATDGSVWVYQIDGGLVQVMSGFSHTLECNAGDFIDKGTEELFLVTVSEDGSVISWNCFTAQVVYKLSPHDEFKGVESPWVSLSVFENKMAVGARDGNLAIINYDTGRLVHSVKTLENIDDVAELSVEALSWCQTPSINLLAVGLVSGDLLLFDTLQWRVRNSVKLEDTITKLKFLANTPVLIGSCMNGRIYKWDARTMKELFVGYGHNMGVLDFAVLDDGKVATAGDEGVSLVFATEQ